MELKKELIFVILIVILILVIIYQTYSFNKSLDDIKNVHQSKPISKSIAPNPPSQPIPIIQKPQRHNISTDDNITITYYYSPNCGACVNFTPEWDKFYSRHNSQYMKKIDCSNNPEMCTGVTNVPHVIFSKNGQDSVYSGARTADALYGFYTGF